MDRSEVITLVKNTKAQDEYGVWRDTPSSRDVFAQVDSVTRAEFFDGGRNGLNPEYRFSLFFGDYGGEQTVIYNGLPYAVYRTYQARKDVLELYVERKGGTNAVADTRSSDVVNIGEADYMRPRT